MCQTGHGKRKEPHVTSRHTGNHFETLVASPREQWQRENRWDECTKTMHARKNKTHDTTNCTHPSEHAPAVGSRIATRFLWCSFWVQVPLYPGADNETTENWLDTFFHLLQHLLLISFILNKRPDHLSCPCPWD